MAYLLEVNERVEEGIRRVVTEEIDTAIGMLEQQPSHLGVHEARKSVKKIRAALRLARAAIGERMFKRENAAFRDIGHLLSEVRDADILVEAFQTIKPRLAAMRLRMVIGRVERHIMRLRRATLTRLVTEGHALARAGAALRAARQRVPQWVLHGKNWSALSPGFEHIYAQGRRRFAAAYKDPTSERFHCWRKRVKDVMSHFRLLGAVYPELLKACADDSQTLAAMLGAEHDLFVLRTVIDNEMREALSVKDRAAVLVAIDDRRSRLAAAARPLGNRVYTVRARDAAERLGRYWNATRLARSQQGHIQARSIASCTASSASKADPNIR